MKSLKGKRIIVAGGATGIGSATAERLAAEGASVVIGDLNLDGAVRTARRVSEAGATRHRHPLRPCKRGFRSRHA